MPMGPELPTTYFHAWLYMVLYVDDFKLAGPTANLKTGWNLLWQGLTIEPEKNQALFLGCIQEVGTFKLPGGKLATSLTYNMESFMDSCVQKYVELARGNVRLKKVPIFSSGRFERWAGWQAGTSRSGC